MVRERYISLANPVHPAHGPLWLAFGALCAGTLAALPATVFAQEPPTIQRGPDHVYRSLLEDTRWLVPPVGQFGQGHDSDPEPWLVDMQAADMDRYRGMSRRFESGVGLDTGIAEHGAAEQDGRYREYYFGLSYDAVEGRIWYTDDYQGGGAGKSFYELGLTQAVGADFSVSARVGYNSFHDQAGIENFTAFALSAEKRDANGFGLNLHLVGSQDPRWGEAEDYRLFGTISKQFP